MVTSFLGFLGYSMHAFSGWGRKGRAGELSASVAASSCPSVGKDYPIVRLSMAIYPAGLCKRLWTPRI
ncbi:hypothetical protein [Pseudomonas sp. D(2018)]|uniref:hypothetical protein n=1 Tax=Pseudomonas sp. D(2018) TaxID=2502238 RepID=UPI0010F82273|nr:hypothetical protein [Pseudomonas sp. D(2018)]